MKNCRIFHQWRLENKKYFSFDNCKKIIKENVKLGFWYYEDYSIKQYPWR